MQSTPPDGEEAAGTAMLPKQSLAPVQVPRISIRFCTQCQWMLRAAYYAQELLSTFSTSIGEVALIPVTGGVFTVDLTHSSPLRATKESPAVGSQRSALSTTRLWDRKVHGGFPETKTLKKLVRDVIDPSRDLGHVDRPKAQESATPTLSTQATTTNIDPKPPPAPELRDQLVSRTVEKQKERVEEEAEEAHSESRSSKSVCEECS